MLSSQFLEVIWQVQESAVFTNVAILHLSPGGATQVVGQGGGGGGGGGEHRGLEGVDCFTQVLVALSQETE
jgi:hypothetical protein